MTKVLAPVVFSVPDNVHSVSVASTVISAGAAADDALPDVDSSAAGVFSFGVQLVNDTPASTAAVTARKGKRFTCWTSRG
ncbi:hypothetical protein MTOK_06710 [Mycolicibacterium tokaiense]|nr:hypothetical protein MTOK_06710 [Mycolicibacterium tokaiense]